ncbi:carnitine O-acetyltransferase-like [Engraulis encrasicolus]|uniref:carnitine O-acetyltransferase-like n=1 Tax=Engraulis encrasicolus TaxID=184585 RepID=UPI002FD53962
MLSLLARTVPTCGWGRACPALLVKSGVGVGPVGGAVGPVGCLLEGTGRRSMVVVPEGLPKLPVPPLKTTFERYLAALEPLLSPEEMEHTRDLVAEFLTSGVGDRLQKSLERRARKTENWLCDYWLQYYLDSRMPVAMYTSPGVVLPRMHFQDRQGQMRFAAKLIAGVLSFKKMLDNDTLPVQHLRGKPLCMDQYYHVLSSCRLPGPKKDTVVNYAISSTPPRHITVVHNFQFFVLDVYTSDGSPLAVDQIYMQLEKIWNSSLQTNKEPIGLLTSQHRNTWGKAYSNLIKDKTNKESVRAIERSIFTVCLDAPLPRVSDELYHSRVAAQMLHGGGSRWNSGNRWFDKTLQFIIGEDGSCGLTYEHAPTEGPPIMYLVDYVVEYMKRTTLPRAPMIPLSMPVKLRFNITPEIKKDIEKAKQNMNIMVQELDVRAFIFSEFGKDVIKSHKVSPDGFVQMAMQLAYYRMYKECCSTYESASLRMFRLGRTETIRSTSLDSFAFVKAMDDPNKQNSEKIELLEKAIKAHRVYADLAVNGQAIDRHLLGLKMQAIEDLTSMPDIFMDTAYAVAEHFNLYTSQVGSETDCVMCLGPLVPDGYGVCYNPMASHINFAITAFNSCEETNATRYSRDLQRALADMKTLLDTQNI